jgi:hypothetical protein
MFKETVVKGLMTGGEGKGREGNGDGNVGNDGVDGDDGNDGNVGMDGEDGGGGSASNVRIEGVACSSTRLGNRFELKGETGVDWVEDKGRVNGLVDGGVPQIVLR